MFQSTSVLTINAGIEMMFQDGSNQARNQDRPLPSSGKGAEDLLSG
jgi:hypothetical protein